jgi:hypothetical protein
MTGADSTISRLADHAQSASVQSKGCAGPSGNAVQSAPVARDQVNEERRVGTENCGL